MHAVVIFCSNGKAKDSGGVELSILSDVESAELLVSSLSVLLAPAVRHCFARVVFLFRIGQFNIRCHRRSM